MKAMWVSLPGIAAGRWAFGEPGAGSPVSALGSCAIAAGGSRITVARASKAKERRRAKTRMRPDANNISTLLSTADV
jgi:hypothetical protein